MWRRYIILVKYDGCIFYVMKCCFEKQKQQCKYTVNVEVAGVHIQVYTTKSQDINVFYTKSKVYGIHLLTSHYCFRKVYTELLRLGFVEHQPYPHALWGDCYCYVNSFIVSWLLWESVGLWFGVRMASLWARMGSGEFVRDNISVWDNKAMSLVKRFKAFTFRWKNATNRQIVFANILLYSCKVFQRKIEFSQDLHHAFTFSLQNPFRDVRWPRNPLRQDMAIAWNWKVILTLCRCGEVERSEVTWNWGVVSIWRCQIAVFCRLFETRGWSMMCSHMHVMSLYFYMPLFTICTEMFALSFLKLKWSDLQSGCTLRAFLIYTNHNQPGDHYTLYTLGVRPNERERENACEIGGKWWQFINYNFVWLSCIEFIWVYSPACCNINRPGWLNCVEFTVCHAATLSWFASWNEEFLVVVLAKVFS